MRDWDMCARFSLAFGGLFSIAVLKGDLAIAIAVLGMFLAAAFWRSSE